MWDHACRRVTFKTSKLCCTYGNQNEEDTCGLPKALQPMSRPSSVIIRCRRPCAAVLLSISGSNEATAFTYSCTAQLLSTQSLSCQFLTFNNTMANVMYCCRDVLGTRICHHRQHQDIENIAMAILPGCMTTHEKPAYLPASGPYLSSLLKHLSTAGTGCRALLRRLLLSYLTGKLWQLVEWS